MMPPCAYRVTANEPDLTLYITMSVTIGFISFEYKLWTEFHSYGKLSYLRPRGMECMLGAVVTSSGQSVNQSVCVKSVRRRRIAIADTYRAKKMLRYTDIILVTRLNPNKL